MPKLTRAFKGRVLAVHRLEDEHTIIGRDADCDIQIDSLAVAPRHVELITRGESCQLRALDLAYPVYINDHPVTLAPLNHGDILYIGKHSLTFAKDGVVLGEHADATDPVNNAVSVTESVDEESQKKKNLAAYLQIQSGAHLGRVIPLNQTLVQLGKAGSNCAIITRRHDGYYLSCLEGDTVTVNSVQVDTESVLLQDGSLIQIGATRFQFYFQPI